jgi:hypothetical protein
MGISVSRNPERRRDRIALSPVRCCRSNVWIEALCLLGRRGGFGALAALDPADWIEQDVALPESALKMEPVLPPLAGTLGITHLADGSVQQLETDLPGIRVA